jgi:hypothetical protein
MFLFLFIHGIPELTLTDLKFTALHSGARRPIGAEQIPPSYNGPDILESFHIPEQTADYEYINDNTGIVFAEMSNYLYLVFKNGETDPFDPTAVDVMPECNAFTEPIRGEDDRLIKIWILIADHEIIALFHEHLTVGAVFVLGLPTEVDIPWSCYL